VTEQQAQARMYDLVVMGDAIQEALGLIHDQLETNAEERRTLLHQFPCLNFRRRPSAEPTQVPPEDFGDVCESQK
jgi:hypothetical protein